MRDQLPNYAPEIKRSIQDVRRLCDVLGMTSKPRSWKKQAGGLIVRCPAHNENDPSCSVQLRGDEILWKCHSCDQGGDVLSFIAAARGLSVQGSGFREVLIEAAHIAGLHGVVDALEGRGPALPPRPAPVRREETLPDREYPSKREVDELWSASRGVTEDAAVSALLMGRAIDPERVERADAARALPVSGALPRWASYRGGAPKSRPWRDLGYSLILPVYDHAGVMRSVRAWRVGDGDGPKRLPPSGCKASGLCMLDQYALGMVRKEWAGVDRVVIVEGEPDMLSRVVVSDDPHVATYGLVSGSWNDAWSDTIPEGSRVVIRTDHDRAGNRYMTECFDSIKARRFGCLVLRGEP